MLCESAERPPEGQEWRYELKLDGFREIGRKSGHSAQLWSRNQKDFTRRFPGVVKGIEELPSDTVIDGEIVALDENRKPSFNLLQGFGCGASAIVLYAFDLLMLQGKDVRLGRSKIVARSFVRSYPSCRIQSAIRKPSRCRFQNWCGQ
jgi:ATP-dependent DNA ligase